MDALEPEPGMEGGVAECVDGRGGEFNEFVVECCWMGEMRRIGDYVGLIFMDWWI